ncbi:hypothetical protein AXF42_Ash010404 [Apostasia shenzhenica]|uniref:RING-type domain-containing protein n=1 Tax=Apostasia shenzhenica TaxID=1088818 RepID=A0A2I0BDW7_9ASPA|nr:hypothetical protein AXF42_Ash010404 [Apostasia shenzhenica]
MPSLPFPLYPPSSMAVEAHHLRLFSPQFLMNREPDKASENIPAMIGNAQRSASVAVGATSESGITVAAGAGMKRPREPLAFLGEDLSPHLEQQMLEVDGLLAHYTARMRAEIAERRRRFSRQLAAAMADGVRKRLKAKDEEIEKVKRMNWALGERIRSLCFENQVLRELAQTNEAAANLLRSNLEQILAAGQLRGKEEEQQRFDGGATDDAGSCCCGENDHVEASSARVCRSCGEREPTVLLLPCRHLCLCAPCGSANNYCPICNCFKSGSVNVNLS